MRVLAYSLPMPGHVFPFLPILQELARRGHDVAMATGQALLDTVRGAGVRAMGVGGVLEAPTEDWQVRTLRAARSLEQKVVSGRAASAADLERLIAAERPDLLMLDPLVWGGLIAAEASGLPWAPLAHTPLLLTARGPRLFGPGLAPAQGRLGRWREALLARGMRLLFDAPLPALNDVRLARGLGPLPSTVDHLKRAPLTIACTSPPFEYTRDDWLPSLRFVGPISWEPPAAGGPELDVAATQPLIVVASSSHYQADDILSDVALAALRNEPVTVVVTKPAGELPTSPPANARVVRYAPHGPLLERAACLVCHGGLGVTQKALALGVPVVAVPFGRDQFEIARRLEVSEAGVYLRREQLRPGRLREAVRLATTRRPGALRIAAAFAAAGGVRVAADEVEALAARWPR
jgi:UDP:flavonoid glycosyltransferase YjiC (YdhE family)